MQFTPATHARDRGFQPLRRTPGPHFTSKTDLINSEDSLSIEITSQPGDTTPSISSQKLSGTIITGFGISSEKASAACNGVKSGSWTKRERERFIEATKMWRTDWQKVSDYVGTRNPKQVRWHANELRKKACHNINSVPADLFEFLIPSRDVW